MLIGTIRSQMWRLGPLVLGVALLLPAAGAAQSPDKAQDQNENDKVRAKIDELIRAAFAANKEGTAQLKLMQALQTIQPNSDQAADKERLQVELKKMEAILQQKMAEVQELQAQIHMMSAKLKMAQEVRSLPGAKLPEQSSRIVIALPENKAAEEIHLRKVGDKWEVVSPTERRAVIRMDQPRLELVAPAPVVPPPAVRPDGLQIRVRPGTAPAMPEKRLDELEKKIDKVMQQLDQMRRDMKGGRTEVELTPKGDLTGTLRLWLESKPSGEKK